MQYKHEHHAKLPAQELHASSSFMPSNHHAHNQNQILAQKARSPITQNPTRAPTLAKLAPSFAAAPVYWLGAPVLVFVAPIGVGLVNNVVVDNEPIQQLAY
jgi:hypothetical protein